MPHHMPLRPWLDSELFVHLAPQQPQATGVHFPTNWAAGSERGTRCTSQEAQRQPTTLTFT